MRIPSSNSYRSNRGMEKEKGHERPPTPGPSKLSEKDGQTSCWLNRLLTGECLPNPSRRVQLNHEIVLPFVVLGGHEVGPWVMKITARE